MANDATNTATPAAKSRIYLIYEDGKPLKFVRAQSGAQAIRHIVGTRYESVLADADHILANRDLEIETADNVAPPLV